MKRVVFITVLLLFISSSPIYSQDESRQEEVAAALAECNQSVVTIVVFDAKKKEIGQGKGVIISPDGLVLTNYHLISQAHSAKIQYAGKKISKKVEWDDVFYPSYDREEGEKLKKSTKKGKWVDVKGIAGINKTLDLALIQISKKGGSPSPLASYDQIKTGTKIHVVVNDESLAEGSITGIQNLTANIIIAQVSINIPSDMSGSPVFNDQGQVIGIASHYVENSNLVLPVAYASELLKADKVTPLSKQAHEDYFASPEGLYAKAKAHSFLIEYSQALDFIQQSVSLKTDNADAYSLQGFLHSKLNQYDKAVDVYQKALSMNPNDYLASFGLGVAHFRLRQYQQAIDPLIQSTKTNPDFPDAYYNLGMAYETLNQLPHAAEAFQQFVRTNPGPAWIGLGQLGAVYVKMKQYDKAIEVYEEVVKTTPTDTKANNNLAHAYSMSGQYNQAAEIYKNLLTLDTKNANAYTSRLFLLYDKAGDYDNAIAVCREIINQDPDNPQNHYNLGYVLLKKKDLANAQMAFQKALELKPDFDLAYSQLGLVFFNQQNYSEAVNALTKYIQLKDDNPDAFYLLGTSYLQIKKYDKSLEPFQKCIALKPDHTYAHYNLAIAYYVLKDRFSANEEYKKLRSLNPELADKLNKIINK